MPIIPGPTVHRKIRVRGVSRQVPDLQASLDQVDGRAGLKTSHAVTRQLVQVISPHETVRVPCLGAPGALMACYGQRHSIDNVTCDRLRTVNLQTPLPGSTRWISLSTTPPCSSGSSCSRSPRRVSGIQDHQRDALFQKRFYWHDGHMARMKAAPGPGRPSKGDRKVLVTRADVRTAELIIALAEQSGTSISEYIAWVLSNHVGRPQDAPWLAAPSSKGQQPLPEVEERLVS